MTLNAQQANAITSAVWLVGLGTLLTTGWFWPGILFVVGISSIVQGFVEGRGWAGLQAGLWMLGLGAWALTSFNILMLFIVIAMAGLFEAFVKPHPSSTKPEPDSGLIDDGF